MNDFKEKFQHLNFNQQPTNHTNDNIKNQFNKSDNKNNKTSYAIFKELLKTISENTQQDKIFILLLITMLKSKKASNELILALLYIFL